MKVNETHIATLSCMLHRNYSYCTVQLCSYSYYAVTSIAVHDTHRTIHYYSMLVHP